jgi:hypothetical protein
MFTIMQQFRFFFNQTCAVQGGMDFDETIYNYFKFLKYPIIETTKTVLCCINK